MMKKQQKQFQKEKTRALDNFRRRAKTIKERSGVEIKVDPSKIKTRRDINTLNSMNVKSFKKGQFKGENLIKSITLPSRNAERSWKTTFDNIKDIKAILKEGNRSFKIQGDLFKINYRQTAGFIFTKFKRFSQFAKFKNIRDENAYNNMMYNLQELYANNQSKKGIEDLKKVIEWLESKGTKAVKIVGKYPLAYKAARINIFDSSQPDNLKRLSTNIKVIVAGYQTIPQFAAWLKIQKALEVAEEAAEEAAQAYLNAHGVPVDL